MASRSRTPSWWVEHWGFQVRVLSLCFQSDTSDDSYRWALLALIDEEYENQARFENIEQFNDFYATIA